MVPRLRDSRVQASSGRGGAFSRNLGTVLPCTPKEQFFPSFRDADAPNDEEPNEGEGLTPAAVTAAAVSSAPSAPPAAASSPGPGRPRTPPPTYADVIEEDRRKMDTADIK